jgi:hypothetical protein
VCFDVSCILCFMFVVLQINYGHSVQSVMWISLLLICAQNVSCYKEISFEFDVCVKIVK